MKTSKALKYLYLGVGATALLFGSAHQAKAQVQPVDVDVAIQNTLTITLVNDMNFGVLVAIGAAANTATMPMNTVGVLGPATTSGGTAYMAVVDAANAQAAQLTVEDGADGATINITIQNVVNPNFGGSVLSLGGWLTSYNGGAPTARTAGTPFTAVFSTAFALINTLDIGASLSTGNFTYTDGNYDGGFDVAFSY